MKRRRQPMAIREVWFKADFTYSSKPTITEVEVMRSTAECLFILDWRGVERRHLKATNDYRYCGERQEAVQYIKGRIERVLEEWRKTVTFYEGLLKQEDY
jgi:hypothetical protein